MRGSIAAILTLCVTTLCLAKDDPNPKSLTEAMDHASKLSQLTRTGSIPFHFEGHHSWAG